MTQKYCYRNKALDVGCGILIIWMIAYHAFIESAISDNISNFLFSIFYFFMPWFFYKAGIYWKPKTIKETAIYSFKRLLIPYILFSIIGHVIWCFCIYVQGDSNWKHYILSPLKAVLNYGAVAGNMPLWFLSSLFVIRLLYTMINNANINKYLLLLCCLSGCWGLNFCEFEKPIYIANILSGMFYFSLGNILPPPKCKKLLPAAFICYSIIIIFFPSWVLMYNNKLILGCYIVWHLYSVAGIICFNALCEKLSSKHLSQIGRNSMGYYISHMPIILLINTINETYLHLEEYCVFALIMLVMLLTLPIITYGLKAQKII